MIAVPVSCVVDASVGIKLVVTEADSPLAQDLFAHLRSDPRAAFFAPDFLLTECANILWKLALKKQVLSSADAVTKLAELASLPLIRIPSSILRDRAMELALRCNVTVYDALYAAAAEFRGVPLVSADNALVRSIHGHACQALLLGSFPIPSPPATTP
jgi:predicted nucleic acid-binding protein